MNAACIVAEYNPFHAGHAFHIRETRRLLGDCAVIAVMSGSFVQRGDCAVFDKWTRARMALEGGVDLVLELPTVYAASSAEGFARGAAAVLEASGAAEYLSFGSECGEISPLRRVAECLDCEEYRAGLRRFLDEGLPFAACRQGAVRGLLGARAAELLSAPNNNLGIEYIRALNALGSKIEPVTILRTGAAHDGGDHPEYPSASFLRERILAEKTENPAAFQYEERFFSLSPSSIGGSGKEEKKPASFQYKERFFPLSSSSAGGSGKEEKNPACLKYGERAVLAVLRAMGEEDFAALPDCGEGLSRRIYQAVRQGRTLEEVCALAKTKRYAHARIRRAVLWGALGLRLADRPASPPYIRVLGANGRGREVLRGMKGRAAVPIITKPAHGRGIPLFEAEARCTDFYQLCRRDPGPCGGEWTHSPVMIP